MGGYHWQKHWNSDLTSKAHLENTRIIIAVVWNCITTTTATDHLIFELGHMINIAAQN